MLENIFSQIKEVSAAIIKNPENGLYLICQRAIDDDCPLLWEFPGGKKEKDESIEECIIREMKEELAVDIEIEDIYAETYTTFNEKPLKFTFFLCNITCGEIKLNVHAQIKWEKATNFHLYEFLPADVEICESLAEIERLLE